MSTLDDKKQQYIADIRQWVRDYQGLMQRFWKLDNDWGLYQSQLLEDDIPDSVMPNPDKLTSLTEAFANGQTILANFDAGIDTNFERVA